MEANEKKIKELIKNPAIVKKMRDYVTLNGYEPHSEPQMLAGQCCIIREKNVLKFADESKQYFATPNDFNRYVTSQEFAFDAPHGADEIEANLGWYGFDDEETHHIAPLIMGALAVGGKVVKGIKTAKDAKKAVAPQGMTKKGAGIFGKIFKKKTAPTTEQPTGALIQRAGRNVKKLVKLKQKQQAQLNEAQAKADYLNAQVNALQSGVPENQVQGQSLETIKEATNLENASKDAGAKSPASLVPQTSNTAMLGGGLLLLLLLFLVFKR